MKTVEIVNIEDLIKGDSVLIKYLDHWTKRFVVKLYKVVKVQEIGHDIEIILKIHGNVWFSMRDYLEGHAFINGRSKLLTVLKIES